LLDAFVLSSTRESFPLAAREAMAAGKPRYRAAYRRVPVEDGITGYLFEPRNVEELAERMGRILGDGQCRVLGQAARSRVERLFSRRLWVDSDERVYLEQFEN